MHRSQLNIGDTRTLLAAARREMCDFHPDASSGLMTYVLPFLSDDVVGTLCRYDSLAILYGNKYIEQYVADDQANLVKGHMRLMMRVLFEMKLLIGNITDLESAFEPQYFDTFIKAVEKICKVPKRLFVYHTMLTPYV